MKSQNMVKTTGKRDLNKGFKMKKVLSILVIFTLFSCAETKPTEVAATGSADWSSYQKILDIGIKKTSYTGKYGDFEHNAFDYQALIKHSEFKTLISQQKENLKNATAPENRFEKLAFWINAYNFFTIVDVTAEFPVDSMKDIGWKNERHTVGGKKYSLDHIEHKILRPMGEPKIHFAINCASVSCPSLYDKVFEGKTVGATLKMLTEAAFKNPLHIRPDDDEVDVTKLMDWFEEDFEVRPFKSAEGFLKRYAPKELQKEIDGYISYNWNINNAENIAKAMKELDVKVKEN